LFSRVSVDETGRTFRSAVRPWPRHFLTLTLADKLNMVARPPGYFDIAQMAWFPSATSTDPAAGWLPEPVVDEALDADAAGDLAHDLSVALILVLERLSLLQRASFLLHDVFGLDFVEVGRALGRGEAACRQLAARARAHIRAYAGWNRSSGCDNALI